MLEKLSMAIFEDLKMLSILEIVRDLNLPDCWIGAGFVRNKAWDLLHGYTEPLELNDVDVVFYDRARAEDLAFEKQIERRLLKEKPEVMWEVVNQARTHKWHGRKPYTSTTEAISEWVETATCIGVRLKVNNELEFTTPHGTEDLENLIVRPVPSLKKLDDFQRRVESKGWLKS